LALPIAVIVGFFYAFKWSKLAPYRKYVLPFLNLFFFLAFVRICLSAGIWSYWLFAIFAVALVYTILFYRHYKKVVVFQWLLALIGLYSFAMTLISQYNFTNSWQEQPDDIENAEFSVRPNIYLIQPDGYSSFSEIEKGYYHHNNNQFKDYLEGHGFVNYPNFRSNYVSTLSSNSSLFTMRHHFYNRGHGWNEALNSRQIIMKDNTVLSVLKKNGYKTHFMAEKPYLLVNRPELGFDYINYSYEDIPFITDGLDLKRDVLEDVKSQISIDSIRPKFYFLQIFNPGHINNKSIATAEAERTKWLESLTKANLKLKNLIDFITEKDPNAMIVIMSDHGGYVGLERKGELYDKTQDRDKLYSIFGSLLSIKWEENVTDSYQKELKSPVNLFRVLFTHLSGNVQYLEKLEDNSSYAIIYRGAPKGIYKYIDNDGNVTFEKQMLHR
ncbi:MAG: sulfatase-like hydrolase/transferase, partial [Flavobacteriaceae bacterium]|nr:sulfatase-like hydrolase/transferase [Flavobacteriaceae bacterium]